MGLVVVVVVAAAVAVAVFAAAVYAFLNAYFTNEHQTLVQSIQGHGRIDHAIVVGLYFVLLMRLSYYIHLGCGKKLCVHIGIKQWSF